MNVADEANSIADLLPLAQRDAHGSLRVSSIVDGHALPGDAEPYERVSPANNAETFTNSPLSRAQTDRAIQVARRGFDSGSWGRMNARDRARILWRGAEAVSDAKDRLAALLMAEAGKPIREARGEVGALVNSLEYFAGLARTLGGRTESGISSDLLAMTVREPAGVAGLIIPWNFPLGILAQKLPPALAAGNTVIVKPSPFTPLSTIAVADILFAAGLPADALTVVVGDADAGAAIVESSMTDVISFTGSTGVGRVIAHTAGVNRLKPVAIEAGGKTPVIVLDSADLESTIEGILFSAYFNQGQVCVAGSRVMVQAGIRDALVEGLIKRIAQIRVGAPHDESTELGPLISAQHFEHVATRVQASITAGAKLLLGGEQLLSGAAAGPYFSPTVLRTDDDANSAITEEIFGPVTAIQSFDTLGEVVGRANAQVFGLAASVWGRDTDQAFSVAQKLRVGTVWINGSTDSHPELPLGGRRDSGFAAEFGREGMEFFTALKTMMVRTGGPTTPWYGAQR